MKFDSLNNARQAFTILKQAGLNPKPQAFRTRERVGNWYIYSYQSEDPSSENMVTYKKDVNLDVFFDVTINGHTICTTNDKFIITHHIERFVTDENSFDTLKKVLLENSIDTLKLVTYLDSVLDKNKISPIKNTNSQKPTGGLWACKGEEWVKWCQNEGFGLGTLKSEFYLRKETCLMLETVSQVKKLPSKYFRNSMFQKYLDFEAISKDYKSILFSDKVVGNYRFPKPNELDLYTYDIPCVLVLSPDAIL